MQIQIHIISLPGELCKLRVLHLQLQPTSGQAPAPPRDLRRLHVASGDQLRSSPPAAEGIPLLPKPPSSAHLLPISIPSGQAEDSVQPSRKQPPACRRELFSPGAAPSAQSFSLRFSVYASIIPPPPPTPAVTSTTAGRGRDRHEGCGDNNYYFPGCRKDTNCTCEICLASINATIDLVPTRSSITKLSPLPGVEPATPPSTIIHIPTRAKPAAALLLLIAGYPFSP